MNPERRGVPIAEALRRVANRHHDLPIHRQMLTWASRAGVTPVPMPDNAVRLAWMRVEPRADGAVACLSAIGAL